MTAQVPELGPDLLFSSDVAVPEVWLQLPVGTRVRYVLAVEEAPDPWQPDEGGWPV
jgi:hypothetical protein